MVLPMANGRIKKDEVILRGFFWRRLGTTVELCNMSDEAPLQEIPPAVYVAKRGKPARTFLVLVDLDPLIGWDI
jgi:hypothetical protein